MFSNSPFEIIYVVIDFGCTVCALPKTPMGDLRQTLKYGDILPSSVPLILPQGAFGTDSAFFTFVVVCGSECLSIPHG